MARSIVYFHNMNSRRLLDAIETTQKDLGEVRELLADFVRDPGLSAPALFAGAILIDARISKAST